MQGREADVRGDADPRITFGELVLHPAAVGPRDGDAIDPPERSAEERLAGREHVAIIAILPQHHVHHRAQGLLAGIVGDSRAERRVDDRVLFKSRDVLEVEHIVKEKAQALLEARRVEQAINLLLHHPWRVQLAALGDAQQLVIGRSAPQEETQPCGFGVGIEAHRTFAIRIGLDLLDDEEERGRNQHARESCGEPLVETAELGGGSVRHGYGCIEFIFAQGPAVQQSTRVAEKQACALRIGAQRIGRRAGDEKVAVFLARHLRCNGSRHAIELLETCGSDVRIRRTNRQQAVGPNQRIEGATDRDLLAKDIGDDAPILRLGQQTHAGFSAAGCRRSAAAGRQNPKRQGKRQQGNTTHTTHRNHSLTRCHQP